MQKELKMKIRNMAVGIVVVGAIFTGGVGDCDRVVRKSGKKRRPLGDGC